VFSEILKGFAKACKAAGCAIIGGETAQMPGMYRRGEYDVAGCIVGVVDRAKILDGSKVRKGDVLVGLSSNGLHTNGYSLARRILFDKLKLKLEDKPDGFTVTLAEELLKVHRNYQPTMAALPDRVLKAAAHITGGGLIDNLPRVLPKDCDARIDTASWKLPAVFRLLGEGGKVDRNEMYQVFNMGIGMVLIVSPKDAAAVCKQAKGRVIGEIVPGTGVVRID
jgi:phosphoribosylformylglycinamidine cyclo-ligase